MLKIVPKRDFYKDNEKQKKMVILLGITAFLVVLFGVFLAISYSRTLIALGLYLIGAALFAFAFFVKREIQTNNSIMAIKIAFSEEKDGFIIADNFIKTDEIEKAVILTNLREDDSFLKRDTQDRKVVTLMLKTERTDFGHFADVMKINDVHWVSVRLSDIMGYDDAFASIDHIFEPLVRRKIPSAYISSVVEFYELAYKGRI